MKVVAAGTRDQGFIIAIDGPAGAGKSTIAKRLAERLRFAHVDTGAIYRSAALAAVEGGAQSPEAVVALTRALDVRLDGPQVFLGDRDVTQVIRSQTISEAASRVSAIPEVRAGLLEIQRRLGRGHPQGAVLEGRDIGTVVFPDAELKIFLTASDEERARRRTGDLERAGKPEAFENVLQSIQARDQRDRQREVAPLKVADDAILIDTTELTEDEVLDRIVDLARERGVRVP